MTQRKKIAKLLCIVVVIAAGLVRPCPSSAAEPGTPPSTGPTTSPSDDELKPADDLLEAASNDLNSGKAEDALAKYQSASDLYKKLQVSEETTEHAACLNGEGLCLNQLRRSADALPVCKAALEICQRLHKNEDDSDVATAMVNLAHCLANLDRCQDALPLDQAALEMRQRLDKGEDSPELAWSTTSVAKDLGALDRGAEALPLYQQALEMRRRLHKGEDDDDVADSCFNLGDCLQDLGRPADALTNFQAALEMRQRLRKGADDADVATTQNSVGFCLYALGRYDEALKVFQSTLDMRRRMYQRDDQLDVVASMNNVAQCLDALGRDSEGLVLYQSALASTRRMYKDQDNTAVAVVMDNVAGCMESLGRGTEALPMFQSALEMRRRIYAGQDDTDVASSLNNLATCLEFLGRGQEALANFQAAHDMLERIHKGQDSPDVATALANIASCLDALGRCAEALPDHDAALEMRRRIYKDADHPDIAHSLNNQSICFTSLGRHADALLAQQAALEMWQRLYKDQDHPDLATAMSNVAVSLDNLGRSAEALPLYQSAIAMRRRLKDQDPSGFAIDLALLGGCLMSLDRPDEALPYTREALDMQQRIHHGRDHPMLAWSMAKVGSCLSALGKKPDALPMFQEAVAMSERMSDPDLYRYSSNLGDCLLSLKRLGEAETAYKISIDALERARAILGGDDEDRMKFIDAQDDCDAFVAMVRVQLESNRADRAAEYLDRGRGRNLLDRLERAEHQTGGDFLAPLEARARQAHDRRLEQQLEQAGKAIADADERVRELTSQINFARSLKSDDGNLQIEQLQPKLDAACQQYKEAHQRLFNAAGTTTFAEPASAAQIQSFLKPGQHLLMYSISDRDAVVILIPPPGGVITGNVLTEPDGKTALSGVSLTRSIVNYQQSVVAHNQSFTRGARLVDDDSTTHSTDDMTQKGYELFSQLVTATIWDQIKDDQLVYVVPDAGMNGLPLETLIVTKPSSPNAKDCQYWLDHGPPISYGPSGSALLKLCSQGTAGVPKHYAHQAVLLGDPVLQRAASDLSLAGSPEVGKTRNAALGAYGALSPLPGTRNEVLGIYEKLTGHKYAVQHDDSVVVLLGEDATDKQLADAAAGTRYLHLATHGLARSGQDAIYSSIVLTQPRLVTAEDTGLLTLQDLFDHWGGKLGGTELVVLSACDSQGIDQRRSNAVTDEGVFGLPWGFWCAGCPAVIASEWEVQDDSTAKLMEAFYRDLQSATPASKLAAFTSARKQLRQEYPEPFFWAPFIYLGNPN